MAGMTPTTPRLLHAGCIATPRFQLMPFESEPKGVRLTHALTFPSLSATPETDDCLIAGNRAV